MDVHFGPKILSSVPEYETGNMKIKGELIVEAQKADSGTILVVTTKASFLQTK